jgi:hypothetical protein
MPHPGFIAARWPTSGRRRSHIEQPRHIRITDQDRNDLDASIVLFVALMEVDVLPEQSAVSGYQFGNCAGARKPDCGA